MKPATNLLSTSKIRTVLQSSAAESARKGLGLAGREILWSTGMFISVASSVFVLRVMTSVVGKYIPKSLWEGAESLLSELNPKEESPATNRPQLLFEHVGFKFYRHTTTYQGQLWACPLLIPDPCARCEWFVRGDNGKPYCAAVAKIDSKRDPRFEHKNLYDILDFVKANVLRGAAQPHA